MDHLWREEDRCVASANGRRWKAHNVVVANGSGRPPKVPGFAAELAATNVKFHSSAYRNPQQLQEALS